MSRKYQTGSFAARRPTTANIDAVASNNSQTKILTGPSCIECLTKRFLAVHGAADRPSSYFFSSRDRRNDCR
ncbi:protein of unknown function [Aminobacter niigataensis]|nr:protein of unknown function [Aminobacter niigataensis]